MTETALHIMLAAGGTGGHMMPADVLAGELRRRGHKVSFISDDRGARLPDIFTVGEKLTLKARPSVGLVGKITFLFGLMFGVLRVLSFLRAQKPDVIVGFGGYPSAPAVVGGMVSRTPIMLHEQNAVVGRTNRKAAKYAQLLALSWPDTMQIPAKVKTAISGLPVRADVRGIGPVKAPEHDRKMHILVIGGSQGAHILSVIVASALAGLAPTAQTGIKVTHQVREDDIEAVQVIYSQSAIEADVASYYTDLPSRLSGAHLIIARSGASTVAELSVAGRASILVPLAIATDDHQTYNANFLETAGAATVMAESDFNSESLKALIEDMLKSPASLVTAGQKAQHAGIEDAHLKLADMVISIAQGTESS